MTSANAEEWFAKIEQLRPADGELTDEILSEIGPLPGLGDPFREAFGRAYVGGRLETYIAGLTVEAHRAETAGNTDEANRLTMELNYWIEVENFVN